MLLTIPEAEAVALGCEVVAACSTSVGKALLGLRIEKGEEFNVLARELKRTARACREEAQSAALDGLASDEPPPPTA